MSAKKVFSGLIAGLFASLILVFSFWGMWLLPALGLLLNRVDILNGVAVVGILGIVGGVIYSLFIGDKELSRLQRTVAGVIFGIILWIGIVLILASIMLGFPPALSSAQDHLLALGVFVVYSISLAFIYQSLMTKASPKNFSIGLGLVLITVLSTPVLLRGAVSTNPDDLELPNGFTAKVLAKDLTYPTGLTMDEQGVIYIAESGYTYGPKTTQARILKVEEDGKTVELASGFNGPLNGLFYAKGKLYISHMGKITALDLNSGEREDLVTDLPSLGDHQNNDVLLGADGALYFGQGTATNAGVVGSDNFVYAWADRHPEFHDVPSRDFILTGENYSSLDLDSTDPTDKKETGAFLPFGETREQGEKIEGKVPANGAVHRLDLDDGTLTIYADGLRNPYGLAVDSDGKIYASVLGYDDRGVRASTNSPDWIVVLEEGAWYGWPDFAGTIALTDEGFASDRGINRNPIIEDPLEVTAPLTSLPPHYSPMKMAFAPDEFAKQGLFVAIFGDGQPLTEDLDRQVASGVILVDPNNGDYEWFIKTKGKARAGRTGDGLKRVIDVKFSQDGKEMYVLDFGIMEFPDMAPNVIPESGVLWKIIADSGTR